MKHFGYVLVFLFVITLPAFSQGIPLDYSVELSGAAATSGELPFWLSANRYGAIYEGGANALIGASIAKPFEETSSGLDYSLGLELNGRLSGKSALYFEQLFGKIQLGPVRLEAGRFHETTGNVYEPLTMGSMSISGNATPVPKIKISLPDYVSVPFTSGYLQVKGAWAHGWMEEDRYVSNTFLHEKQGYVKIGGELPINLTAGIVHWVYWGGDSPDYGKLPSSLNDFFNVSFALGEGGEDAPTPDQEYFLGDHKGFWDFGIDIKLNTLNVKLYKQFILEDKDNVKFKSPQDGLYGLVVENQSNSLVKALIWEFLYTKWQNGPIRPNSENPRGGPGGIDNYYNHSVYRTGWIYFGRTIGSPLLFPKNEGSGIANNRIVAHHWGIKGRFRENIKYRFITTYSRNYGTYDNPIEPRKDNWSLGLTSSLDIPEWENIYLNTTLAVDIGKLYGSNFGFMVGILWERDRY